MYLVYDKYCANLVLYKQCHPWTLLSIHFMKSRLYNYTIEVDYKYAPPIPYYLTYELREWLRKLWKKLKAVDMHNIALIFHFNVIVSIYDISGK